LPDIYIDQSEGQQNSYLPPGIAAGIALIYMYGFIPVMGLLSENCELFWLALRRNAVQ
jgi:hypothetical protein